MHLIRFLPRLCALALGFCFALAGSAQAFEHATLDALLKERVSNGRVDYAALKTDARLGSYLDALAAADVAALGARDARLAFWINAYNAYTLKLVADHHPVKSIRDIPHPGVDSPWDLPVARVGGCDLSLNHIEHQVLRAELKEPRIHYAVVCAAVSCPPLRAEAFVAERIDEQFADQARVFLGTLNRFDAKARRAELSQIFNWFAADFGGEPAAVLRALAPYAPAAVRASLAADSGKWTVTYLDYDWSLNERR
ncbi:MAG: DUF547 domain-containing protein [Candidatus Didemnitutus sp.]|nr:DUF547 domain-containing protein [Candidatus Didemnitutus sp.]